ncbi:glycosyltransferase, partial [Nostoc sp. CHAB 5834]|nr:glycosyltransferase [Nostoc sp. CHAB 5834]
IVVEAFNRLGLPLLMVGDGDMADGIEKRAGPNIKIERRLDFIKLKQAYANCKALIFSAEEDFGIVPVEANASGRPVIAYERGGINDSIIPGQTGLFFKEQSYDAIIEAVESFERWLPHFDPSTAVKNASRFSPEIFDRRFTEAVEKAGRCN